MQENRIHKVLKLLMVVILLLMAYFLPRFWADNGGIRNRANKTGVKREKNEQIVQKNPESEEKIRMKSEDTERMKSKNNRIIVDPGHGGHDPGMIGVGGIKEKDINLQVATVLGELLKEAGYEVIYTRTRDEGLYEEDSENKKAQDMRRRCALIEAKEPLLTVSIHQNSYPDPGVSGPQVFYFEKSVNGEALASCVQEQLNKQLQIANPRPIKGNTNYYILKRSVGTTILVECSFLSNPGEAEKIQTPEYQQAVARAICDGIVEYLSEKEEG